MDDRIITTAADRSFMVIVGDHTFSLTTFEAEIFISHHRRNVKFVSDHCVVLDVDEEGPGTVIVVPERPDTGVFVGPSFIHS